MNKWKINDKVKETCEAKDLKTLFLFHTICFTIFINNIHLTSCLKKKLYMLYSWTSFIYQTISDVLQKFPLPASGTPAYWKAINHS